MFCLYKVIFSAIEVGVFVAVFVYIRRSESRLLPVYYYFLYVLAAVVLLEVGDHPPT
jgi:hypothetical protein